MNRSGPPRRCGRRWPTEEAALHSKLAVTNPGAEFKQGRCCGWWHEVKAAPVPAPRKPARDTGPDAGTRVIVLIRDGYRCARCGDPAGPGIAPYSLQHRVARGVGGDSSVQNLILLCGTAVTGCHGEVESRSDEHDQAAGWRLESWQDPAAEGVLYVSADGSGVMAWLEADGGLSFEGPALVTGGAA